MHPAFMPSIFYSEKTTLLRLLSRKERQKDHCRPPFPCQTLRQGTQFCATRFSLTFVETCPFRTNSVSRDTGRFCNGHPLRYRHLDCSRKVQHRIVRNTASIDVASECKTTFWYQCRTSAVSLVEFLFDKRNRYDSFLPLVNKSVFWSSSSKSCKSNPAVRMAINAICVRKSGE